ncbi:MAG: rRNA maturation RNase YbeY [Nitrospirae bacterium]|nr:rRNA maturation RNase YbeY [Nitrospirota bacterium]
MKVLLKNQQKRIVINPERIKKVLKKAFKLLNLQKAELSILFVNDRRMRALNRQYRGVDRTTDVLAFPQQEGYKLKVASYRLKNKEDFLRNSLPFTHNSPLVLGDIVINIHKAKCQANEFGLTFYDELNRLLIHGLLHLLYYDHEKSRYHNQKMRKKEKELLNRIS